MPRTATPGRQRRADLHRVPAFDLSTAGATAKAAFNSATMRHDATQTNRHGIANSARFAGRLTTATDGGDRARTCDLRFWRPRPLQLGNWFASSSRSGSRSRRCSTRRDSVEPSPASKATVGLDDDFEQITHARASWVRGVSRLSDHVAELPDLVVRELDQGRAHVLLKACVRRGAGNGQRTG
jgi:hypothetical protein